MTHTHRGEDIIGQFMDDPPPFNFCFKSLNLELVGDYHIMAFKLGGGIKVEIQLAFSRENRQPSNEIVDTIKDKCKNHKNLQ